MITFNKRVARILEDGTKIGAERLHKALEEADSKSRSLGSVLVEQRLIEEGELLGILAQHTKVPPIDLRRITPDPTVLAAIPQELAFYYNVFPISRIGNVLTVALTNPYDIVKLDDVRIVTGCDLRPVLTLEDHLRTALDKAYKSGQKEMESMLDDMGTDAEVQLKENKGEDDGPLDLSGEHLAEGDDSPVIKFVNMVIYQASKDKVSDIHIEPFEKKIIIRFRKDGILREAFSPPKRMLNAITSRIKIMASLDIAERRIPQDGKFQMRIDGRQVDFRVSILPVIHGEKTVMRLLDAGNLQLNLDSLGFEQQALEEFRFAIAQPYGMILVTGPTGSGKSTTLYSAVREMMSPEENFITVEDPVEYQLEGVNQVQVSAKRGLTFAAALRSILRQDPDKVLLGEIRDKETIEIAVKAALTGHLVLSTLHTNDAPSTITRMLDMGIDPFMCASALLIVTAQRLCRKLCGSCKKPIETPSVERLLELGMLQKDIDEMELNFHQSVGCGRCANGFAGRYAILETLPMSEDIRRIVIEGGSAEKIKYKGLDNGMMTLRRCAMRSAANGRTSIEEVLRVTLSDKKDKQEADIT